MKGTMKKTPIMFSLDNREFPDVASPQFGFESRDAAPKGKAEDSTRVQVNVGAGAILKPFKRFA
jgi:hypothetical protein